MMVLRCQNKECRKVLSKNDFEILEDDDGDLFIFCRTCADLPWPLSKVFSSGEIQPASLRV